MLQAFSSAQTRLLYLPKLFYSVLFYLISLQWTHFYAKIKPKFIFLEAWPDSRHTITFILSNNIKHTTWTCCEITDQVQKAHRSNNAETKLRFQQQGPRDGSANIWQQVVAKEKFVFFEWLTRICWTFAVGRVKHGAAPKNPLWPLVNHLKNYKLLCSDQMLGVTAQA